MYEKKQEDLSVLYSLWRALHFISMSERASSRGIFIEYSVALAFFQLCLHAPNAAAARDASFRYLYIAVECFYSLFSLSLSVRENGARLSFYYTSKLKFSSRTAAAFNGVILPEASFQKTNNQICIIHVYCVQSESICIKEPSRAIIKIELPRVECIPSRDVVDPCL